MKVYTSAPHVGAAIRRHAEQIFAPGRLALDDAQLGHLSICHTVDQLTIMQRIARTVARLNMVRREEHYGVAGPRREGGKVDDPSS